MKKHKLQELAFTGLLVAIGILLYHLVSISLPNPTNPIIKFGVGFVPIIVVSILYGPVIGGFAGLAQDLLGFFILGGPLFGQTFHPGFTLNAILYGVIPGLFFLRRHLTKKDFYFRLNFVVLFVFSVFVVTYIFDIDQVIATSLTNDQKYLLVGMGLVAAIVLAIFNYWTRKQTIFVYSPTKLLAIVLIMYMIVSLVLTPLWLYFMNPGISFWARLPLRIVKMPIEIIAYVLILTPLMQTVHKLIHKIED